MRQYRNMPLMVEVINAIRKVTTITFESDEKTKDIAFLQNTEEAVLVQFSVLDNGSKQSPYVTLCFREDEEKFIVGWFEMRADEVKEFNPKLPINQSKAVFFFAKRDKQFIEAYNYPETTSINTALFNGDDRLAMMMVLLRVCQKASRALLKIGSAVDA